MAKNARPKALTWEKDSSILIEDGYEWRKYGQKKIMNAKYLRSYYRCSYKSEQDCAAMKQVQRIQEDPPLYRTTYYGHHNCKTSLSTSDVTLLEPNNTSSMIINFNDSFQTKEQFPSFSSSSFSKSTKQEPIDQGINPYHNHIAQNQLISSDYYPLSFWILIPKHVLVYKREEANEEDEVSYLCGCLKAIALSTVL
ncbi:hypothetical protein P8452_56325 [Trifolium repens]|nr:hypothetical protein P8452_56325 [Trifolium repens]